MKICQRVAVIVVLCALSACTTYPRFKPSEKPTDPTDKAYSGSYTGCPARKLSSEEKAEKLAGHSLIVNSIGDTMPKNGSVDFDSNVKTIASAYEAFVKNHPSNKGVLIYVNGGLNTYKEVRDQAAVQIPCMEMDGYFPVFLIWRTGPFETYFEQNNKVRDGVLSANTQATAPLYYAEDIARGIIRAPVTLWDHTRGFKKAFQAGSDSNFHVAVRNEPDGKLKQSLLPFTRFNPDNGVVNKSNNVLYYPLAIDELPSYGDYYVNYTLTTPVRLVTTPFVDSLGETDWENMVRRSRMTIRTAWEFQPEFFPPESSAPSVQDKVFMESQKSLSGNEPNNLATENADTQRQKLIARYPNGTGGFSRFFQTLEWCLEGSTYNKKECPDDMAEVKNLAKAPFTLIGHSMGTIVLSDLIFLYPDLDYQNIVYMAAAASIRQVRATVVPLVEKRGGQTHFYSLMLHPVAEVRETTWGGAVISGSLLEWVDDMYEHPKTYPDRTFGKWRNILATKEMFPEEAQKWMLFKVFGFRPNDPVAHGQFNDTNKRYWMPEFWGAERTEDQLSWACASPKSCPH